MRFGKYCSLIFLYLLILLRLIIVYIFVTKSLMLLLNVNTFMYFVKYYNTYIQYNILLSLFLIYQ